MKHGCKQTQYMIQCVHDIVSLAQLRAALSSSTFKIEIPITAAFKLTV